MEELIAKRVCIVVLADIARSPRMVYHALSLAKEGYMVDMIGYVECPPSRELLTNRRINIYNLTAPPGIFKFFPFLFAYMFKAAWQAFTLLFALMCLRRPQYLLVQNPPAIPTLPICWFFSLIFGCYYIVDWHNYAHCMISLTLKNKSGVIVGLTRWIERQFGGRASYHFCVTKAMKHDMVHTIGVSDAIVHYDRPYSSFQPIGIEDKHELFTRLAKDHVGLGDSACESNSRFTEATSEGRIKLRSDRPALVVSSTSWTEDEDFNILISALQDYDMASSAPESTLPRIHCVITGRGPKRNSYARKIDNMTWNKVDFTLLWVAAEDYPKILASADLGVSLHTSASGLDLPMKVVDMFGSQLPVCAMKFNCIDELVKHDHNGMLFEHSEELSKQFQTLLADFPHSTPKLQDFRSNLRTFRESQWDNNWKDNVSQVFTG